MPKKWFLSCLLFCLLFTGCAGRSHAKKADFLDIRAKWLASEQAELHASVRADYGSRVYDYVLRYSGSPNGGLLAVEEPVMLSGVAVEISADGITLRYDGAELDTGAVFGNLNPVQAFPLLLQCWQSGPVLDCWEENRDGIPCLTVEFDLTGAGERDTRRCRTWFSLEDGAPVSAELMENGRTVVLTNFISC